MQVSQKVQRLLASDVKPGRRRSSAMGIDENSSQESIDGSIEIHKFNAHTDSKWSL